MKKVIFNLHGQKVCKSRTEWCKILGRSASALCVHLQDPDGGQAWVERVLELKSKRTQHLCRNPECSNVVRTEGAACSRRCLRDSRRTESFGDKRGIKKRCPSCKEVFWTTKKNDYCSATCSNTAIGTNNNRIHSNPKYAEKRPELCKTCTEYIQVCLNKHLLTGADFEASMRCYRPIPEKQYTRGECLKSGGRIAHLI